MKRILLVLFLTVTCLGQTPVQSDRNQNNCAPNCGFKSAKERRVSVNEPLPITLLLIGIASLSYGIYKRNKHV